MKFKRFVILDTKDMQPMADSHTVMLINTDHIVSIKPIKIVHSEEIVDGHWIRTSNGKKYRAIQIPDDIKDLISDSKQQELIASTDSNTDDLVIQ